MFGESHLLIGNFTEGHGPIVGKALGLWLGFVKRDIRIIRGFLFSPKHSILDEVPVSQTPNDRVRKFKIYHFINKIIVLSHNSMFWDQICTPGYILVFGSTIKQ